MPPPHGTDSKKQDYSGQHLVGAGGPPGGGDPGMTYTAPTSNLVYWRWFN